MTKEWALEIGSAGALRTGLRDLDEFNAFHPLPDALDPRTERVAGRRGLLRLEAAI